MEVEEAQSMVLAVLLEATVAVVLLAAGSLNSKVHVSVYDFPFLQI